MNRRTVSILVAAGIMVPVLGGAAVAQLQTQRGDRGPGFGPGEPGERAERLFEELDLTEAQVEQIRSLRQAARDEMQDLHETLWTERETLHDLMAGEATEAELRAKHDEIQTLHREVADQRFENMLAVREVLTPEQRAELGQLMEQRRDQRRDMFREYRGDRGLNRRHF
jgi:protein CpxP